SIIYPQGCHVTLAFRTKQRRPYCEVRRAWRRKIRRSGEIGTVTELPRDCLQSLTRRIAERVDRTGPQAGKDQQTRTVPVPEVDQHLPSAVWFWRVGKRYSAAIALQRQPAIWQFDDLYPGSVAFGRGKIVFG